MIRLLVTNPVARQNPVVSRRVTFVEDVINDRLTNVQFEMPVFQILKDDLEMPEIANMYRGKCNE